MKRMKMLSIVLVLMLTTGIYIGVTAAQETFQKYFFHITITTPQEAPYSKMCALLAENLKQIGIDASLHYESWDTTHAMLIALEKRTYDEGGFDLAEHTLELRVEPFVGYVRFYNSLGTSNYPHWDSATADRIMSQAMSIMDPQQRLPYYYSFEELVYEQMPIIPLWQVGGYYVFRNDTVKSGVNELMAWRPVVSDPVYQSRFLDTGSDTIRIAEYFDIPTHIGPLGFGYYTGCQQMLIETGPDLKPTPKLAESWDESADGMTVTFHLRNDVKWSDDVNFTSKDVLFTFNAIMSPLLSCKLYTWFNEIFPQAGAFEAPDDYTVVLHLKAPYIGLFDLLSYTSGAEIMPEHILKNVPYDGWADSDYNTGKTPMPSTGPWLYTESKTGEYVKYERNEKYWNQSDLPHAKYLIYEVIPDTTMHLGMLQTGELSWLDLWSSAETQKSLVDNSTSVYGITGPRFDQEVIYPNMKNPYLANAFVRHAISLCVPRQDFCTNYLQGVSQPTSTCIYLGSWAKNPAVPAFDPLDISAAKQMMQKAGFNYDWLKAVESPTSLFAAYMASGVAIGAVPTAGIAYWIKRRKT